MEHRDRLSGELTHTQEAVEEARKAMEAIVKDHPYFTEVSAWRAAAAWLANTEDK